MAKKDNGKCGAVSEFRITSGGKLSYVCSKHLSLIRRVKGFGFNFIAITASEGMRHVCGFTEQDKRIIAIHSL